MSKGAEKQQNTCTSETWSESAEVARRRLGERKNAIAGIAGALKSSGFTSLDKQAKALGLHRATAWTIIKNKHKIGRLSEKTVNRILTNPETPAAVRVVVRRYLAEK